MNSRTFDIYINIYTGSSHVPQSLFAFQWLLCHARCVIYISNYTLIYIYIYIDIYIYIYIYISVYVLISRRICMLIYLFT